MAARTPASPGPKPVPTAVMCSVCGLDWKRHGTRPTIEKCVELLKADLARVSVRPFIYAGTSSSLTQAAGVATGGFTVGRIVN